MTAAALLETEPTTPREKPGPDFHELLKRNRAAFEQATTEELQEARQHGGRDSATKVLHILKSNEIRHYPAFTEEDDAFLKRVVEVLEQGDIPRSVAKKLLSALDDELQRGISPPRILAQVKQHVAPEFLAEHAAPTAASTAGPREVILSEYFTPADKATEGQRGGGRRLRNGGGHA